SHLRKAYTLSAALAGIAGALLAQTTETVSLAALSFERSADTVVMLVLGGTGRLYGGLVGAIIFMVARDQFSGINPQLWYFWIGLLRVPAVSLLPNGILGGLAQLPQPGRGRASCPSFPPRRCSRRELRRPCRRAASARGSAPSSWPTTSVWS